MGRRKRYIKPYEPLEVTTRTILGTCLLRPHKRVNALIAGVIGKAQQHYPGLELYAWQTQPTHLTMLLAPPDAVTLSRFMGFVNGNIAREVGRLVDWRGPFWGRRYAAIPVLDEQAQVQRLAYVLGQAPKDRQVPRVLDWPGASSARALLIGENDTGIWIDRTRGCRLRSRGKSIPNADLEEQVTIQLSKLPVWSRLSDPEYRAHVQELADKIEKRARKKHKRFFGAKKAKRQSPHARARGLVRSPIPVAHTVHKALWRQRLEELRTFAKTYREVFQPGWLSQDLGRFPVQCFAPSTNLPAA